MAFFQGDKLLIDNTSEAVAMEDSKGYDVTIRYLDRRVETVDVSRVKRIKTYVSGLHIFPEKALDGKTYTEGRLKELNDLETKLKGNK